MKNKRQSILVVLASLAALAFAGYAAAGVTAQTANAKAFLMATIGMKGDKAPAPSCKDPYVFSGKKASCVPCPSGTAKDKATQTCKALPGTPQKCTTTTDANGVKTTVCVTGVQATVAGKKASASALVSGKITILADDTVKGGRKVVQLHSKGCHFYRTFKNSGMDANGHRFWFIDHNGTLCPSKASPTGLVKVSGGKTGRPCMNPAAPMSSPYKVITGTVILVKSFAHFNVPIRASVSVYVQDSCGHAGASVLGSATISLTSFAKAKGNVSIGIFGQTVFNLKESVAANIVCGPTQTITTTTTTSAPPTTTTQTITTTTTTSAPPTCKVQSVEAPEEVYNDGETRPIRAQVTAANGHSITLTFTVPTHYGTFYSPTVGPFTSSGSDQKSATYTAPKDDTSAGKTETVTVSCHDNTTGQDGTPNSASFPIKPVPTVTTGGGSRP